MALSDRSSDMLRQKKYVFWFFFDLTVERGKVGEETVTLVSTSSA